MSEREPNDNNDEDSKVDINISSTGRLSPSSTRDRDDVSVLSSNAAITETDLEGSSAEVRRDSLWSGKLEVASGTDNRIDGSFEGASQQHRGGVEGKSACEAAVESADPPSSSPGTFGSVAGRSPVVEAVTFGLGEAVFVGPETTIVVDDDEPPPGLDASAGAGGGGGG